jgi:hypothetical protein
VSVIPSHRGDSEVVADLDAPARVAKAANTPVAAVLGSDPHHTGGQSSSTGRDGRPVSPTKSKVVSQ